VKALALALGFDVAGVTAAEPGPETRALRGWLERGYGGAMHYLERSLDRREDPRRLFEGARSIVAVGLVYERHEDVRASEADRGAGRVARYAAGDDYHDLLLDRLRALAVGLEAMVGGPVTSRAYVDTGPVIERAHAALAGLGWLGKNTCLIHPELGSYLFLGVLVTDLELAPDVPGEDRCGTCRACLDACPTGALVAPRLMDATRCIAYTTIEDPGSIPEEHREPQGELVFGCDICQEVCPWNSRQGRSWPADPLGLRARLAPRSHWVEPSLAWILGLDEAAWQAATRGSAMRRAKRRGLLRNALVAAGNSGDRDLRPLVDRLASGDDPMLAEHARWALARLDRDSARA